MKSDSLEEFLKLKVQEGLLSEDRAREILEENQARWNKEASKTETEEEKEIRYLDWVYYFNANRIEKNKKNRLDNDGLLQEEKEEW